MYDEYFGDDFWNASYEKFSGHKQRELAAPGKGAVTFDVEISTSSGSLGLSIEDGEGNLLYHERELPTSEFKVELNRADKYVVRFEAEEHYGSFDIRGK